MESSRNRVLKQLFLLSKNYELREITRGSSMFPFFHKTKISIKPYNCNIELSKLDIVVFLNFSRDALVAHRVHKVTDTTVISKGDNNYNKTDWPRLKSEIIGYVHEFQFLNLKIRRNSLCWVLWSYFSTVLYHYSFRQCVFWRTKYKRYTAALKDNSIQ